MSEHVRVTVEAGVMRLLLARPDKKNALTNAMYGTLRDALRRAQDESAIRVVLFEAEGDAFCAGNDIADFAAIAAGTLASAEMNSWSFLQGLAQARKPLVAAVQGLAVGIGFTMLMHCDLVYVAEDARLSAPFVNLALVPEAASTWLVPARIGHARAFEMFALGEPMEGRTAAAIGLANAALPASQVRAKALESARKLAAKPPGSLQATKQLMRNNEAIAAAMAREGEIFSARLRSAEAAEAFKAFAERRPPDYSKLTG